MMRPYDLMGMWLPENEKRHEANFDELFSFHRRHVLLLYIELLLLLSTINKEVDKSIIHPVVFVK